MLDLVWGQDFWALVGPVLPEDFKHVLSVDERTFRVCLELKRDALTSTVLREGVAIILALKSSFVQFQ